jgi:hypothetical protein
LRTTTMRMRRDTLGLQRALVDTVRCVQVRRARHAV